MDFGSLPLALVQQIDEVCDAFESAWRGRRRPRIEVYLDRTADERRPETVPCPARDRDRAPSDRRRGAVVG